MRAARLIGCRTEAVLAGHARGASRSHLSRVPTGWLACRVGVLALPSSFSYLTWGGGPLFLGLCCASSLYTCYTLASLHQTDSGKRYNTYAELGVGCLGGHTCCHQVRMQGCQALQHGVVMAPGGLGKGIDTSVAGDAAQAKHTPAAWHLCLQA